MTYDEMHARHVENMRLGKPVLYGFLESEMARAQILLRDSIARDKVERERAEAQRIREARRNRMCSLNRKVRVSQSAATGIKAVFGLH